MSVKYYSRVKINQEIYKHIYDVDTIIDLGCGIRPQTYIKPKIHICVEPFEEYVQQLRELEKKNDSLIIYKQTAQSIASKYKDKSVDSVFILDVIEHIPKDEALKLIEECKRIAKYQVVLFTPLGMRKQEYPHGEKDGWGHHGGYWQTHRSGWTPWDFNKGWDVLVCERYNYVDHEKKLFNEPQGVLWAIYHNGNNWQGEHAKRTGIYKLQIVDRFMGFILILKLFPKPIKDFVTRLLFDGWVKLDKTSRGVK